MADWLWNHDPLSGHDFHGRTCTVYSGLSGPWLFRVMSYSEDIPENVEVLRTSGLTRLNEIRRVRAVLQHMWRSRLVRFAVVLVAFIAFGYFSNVVTLSACEGSTKHWLSENLTRHPRQRTGRVARRPQNQRPSLGLR